MEENNDLINIKAPDELKQTVTDIEENFKKLYNDVKNDLK
jgi:ABC-type metal ion transport system substrate-binding protein